jgi:hypothetical protein
MASSSEIRSLFKAFSDNPAFHAQVRDAKTPKEKHQIIRQAGHVPVSSDELQAELKNSLPPVSPEDKEFVGNVVHLAAADGATAVDG